MSFGDIDGFWICTFEGREGERERERKGERERERSGEDSSQPRQLISKWEWRSSRDSACGGGGRRRSRRTRFDAATWREMRMGMNERCLFGESLR